MTPTLLRHVLAGTAVFVLVHLAPAATTTVNSISALKTAISAATAGDTIVVKNGTYTSSGAITITQQGASGAPILIRAETIGGVTLAGSGGFRFNAPAAWVTVQGFVFTHSGSISIAFGTSHVRLSRNVVELTIPAGSDVSYVTISGDDAEIDHNEMRNKSTLGEMLDIAGSGTQVAQRLWVHHNYFHDFSSPGGNGAETIRWGLSGLSLSNGYGLCEYNLFVRCEGENESISNKSSANTYRYNTFLDMPGGQLSQRHGNNNLIYGNYFRNSDGIRIYGDGNQVFNNYLEGNTEAIDIGNGDGEVENGAALTSHDKPDNTLIAFNTLINNSRQFFMPGRTGGLGASNTTFVNNLIVGGPTAASISSTGPYSGAVWAGNIIWNTTPGSMPAGTYTTVDPQLAPDEDGIFHLSATSPAIGAAVGVYPNINLDQDGQLRDSFKDVGADEFAVAQITARLLTPDEVGPNSSSGEPAPPPALVFEAENLAFTATGASASVATETTASGGAFPSNSKYVMLNADGNPPPPNGEFIEFTLPNVPRGTYDLLLRYKSHSTSRGIARVSVDGVTLLDVNEMSSTTFREPTIGTVQLAAGNHVIRLAVVGRSSTATAYTITADRFTLVPDDTAPVIGSLPDLTIEATGPDGAIASHSGQAFDEKDGTVPVVFTPPSGSRFPLGTTLVVATAQDFSGNTAAASFEIKVVDTTPPTIRRLTASPSDLGAPNHQLIPVTITADVSDIADASPRTRIIAVTSNEPVDGSGDGNTSPDWEITGDLALNLRAERSGSGGDRVYTITVESRDAAGNLSTATVDVVVPHDRR